MDLGASETSEASIADQADEWTTEWLSTLRVRRVPRSCTQCALRQTMTRTKEETVQTDV